jgi:inorganic pyrophosphatase
MNRRSSLSNPEQLPPTSKEDGLLQIIIETPRGSRNKYSFDSAQNIFSLRKVLPLGMVFPYDFGFLPRTMAEDGGPLDALVLMDEPAVPGCLVQARLIGVVEAEQREGKKRVRNDWLLTVAAATHLYAPVLHYKDLPPGFLSQLQEFFVNYHRLEGKDYKILGCKGPAGASQLIRKLRNSP